MARRRHATALIHAARQGHRSGPLAPLLYQSTTFAAPDIAALAASVTTDQHYTRYDNPNFRMVEATVADLEGAEDAVLFASGMAAISTLCLSILEPRDHIIVQEDLFGGTTEFVQNLLTRFGIGVSATSLTDASNIERAITPATKLVFAETPSNPLLRLVDLDGLARICRANGVRTIVDNTFASPINQNPIDFGIDVVVHSATKYMGGHSDVVAGVVCGRSAPMAAVRNTRRQLGGVLDPHAAVLLLRGLRTLSLRVERQNRTAERVAGWLATHESVATVNYPFLDRHPQSALARRQMRGGGGMISFTLRGGAGAVDAFTRHLSLFFLTGSLGGVESLVTVPALTTHARVPREQREALGITDSLIRMSIGVEDPDDLLSDIDAALTATRHTAGAT